MSEHSCEVWDIACHRVTHVIAGKLQPLLFSRSAALEQAASTVSSVEAAHLAPDCVGVAPLNVIGCGNEELARVWDDASVSCNRTSSQPAQKRVMLWQ
jgi:hypothetical protein